VRTTSPDLNAALYHAIPLELARELDFLDGAMPSPMVSSPQALLIAGVFILGLLLGSGVPVLAAGVGRVGGFGTVPLRRQEAQAVPAGGIVPGLPATGAPEGRPTCRARPD
jgi:hypothetical protein